MITKNMNGIVMGALLGTMLGSAAFLFPKREMLISKMRAKTKELADKTKDFGDTFYEEFKNFGKGQKKELVSEDIVKGTLLGFLLGAGSALLLTPKSGRQLRKDLSATYQEMAEKTRGVMKFINHHPALKRKILAFAPLKKKALTKVRPRKRSKVAIGRSKR